MHWTNLTPLIPEVLLLVFALVVLIVDLFSSDRDRQQCYLLTQVGFIVVAIAIASNLPTEDRIFFNGTFVVDSMGQIFKVAIIFIAGITAFYGRVFIRERKILRGEYYTLTIFATLGMCVMVSAHHLLTLYLGLEILSLTLYAMIAMERGNGLASEASIKYFVTGAIASGFLLYGMSLLYGVSGQLELSAISRATAVIEQSLMAQFAMVFLLAGVAFKLGLVPFHMWLPDVYHGAPTGVTNFIASAPKIAALGFTLRLLNDGLISFVDSWQMLILTAACLSILLGNLLAIAQDNLKRLFAYSGIAHMGYLALGIFVANDAAYAAASFYAFVYAFMTTAAFGLLILLGRKSVEHETLNDLAGLGRRYPWYALMITFVMVSLAGLPPFIGFWPKLEIFRQLVATGNWIIALFAILMSVIALFYYLRVIKVVYFDEPNKEFNLVPSRSIRFAITFNCGMLLVLGFIPDTIYQYCLQAFR